MNALITSSKCADAAAIFPVRFCMPNRILAQERARREGLHNSVGCGATAQFGLMTHREFVSAQVDEEAPRAGLRGWVGYAASAGEAAR